MSSSLLNQLRNGIEFRLIAEKNVINYCQYVNIKSPIS